ncbi:MAG: EVE domain-containing protein [Planctomycetes bacterium]|nr:EVE domain-containing protein [Planctomycetota bacterium]
MKSEPNVYSIDDLKKEKRACWDGVRNYQARNFMRDEMKIGDLVLYYHSNAKPPGVVGIAEVCREGYPDHTALDPKDPHYDPKSSKDNPTWMMVDLKFVEKFAEMVTLDKLKATASLEGMLVTRRGQRLSVQPVESKHFKVVRKLGAG